MTKICLIGSSGFLAKSFGNYFSKQQHYTIDCIGRTLPNYPHNQFIFRDFSITDIDVDTLVNYDIIIYLAGEGIQNNKPTTSYNIININAIVPIKLCSALKVKNYQGAFITFGSYSEIGCNDQKIAFGELEIVHSDQPAPNDYVVSKRLLTNFVYNNKSPYRHLHFILPTIYGKDENPKRLIPYILACKKEGKMVDLTSGDQIRQFILVDEVPNIVQKALSAQAASGIYNIGGGDIIKIKDMVFEIATYWNIPQTQISFGSVDRWDTSMRYLEIDGSKLERLIGYSVLAGFLKNLKDYE